MQIAFVIATKDRPDDLRRTLASLADQSVRPVQVIVVDASAASVALVVQASGLETLYLRSDVASAARQRNAGLEQVSPDAELVGFLDDDIRIAPDAMARMLEFWQAAGPQVGGAGFNLVNGAPRSLMALKRGRLLHRLGLYSNIPGDVAPSGWQSIADNVPANTRVRWLPTTAVLYRREVVQRHRFDAYYTSYSYLEDLDFSYGIAHERELWIVANARYHHFPATSGRIDRRAFGQMEVANRLRFVRKYRLSMRRCALAMLLRGLMTLVAGLRDTREWSRLRGNIIALMARGTPRTHQ